MNMAVKKKAMQEKNMSMDTGKISSPNSLFDVASSAFNQQKDNKKNLQQNRILLMIFDFYCNK